MPTGSSASPAAHAKGRSPRASRRQHAEAAGSPLAARHFGRERLRIELQRPFARHDRRRNRRWPGWRSGSGAHRGHRERARSRRARVPLQDAMVAVGSADARRIRAAQARQLLACARAAEAMADRFREHPDAVAETEPAGGAPPLRPHATSATATPAPRTPTPDPSSRSSAGPLRGALRADDATPPPASTRSCA